MHLDYLIHLLFNLAIRKVYLLVRKGQVLHVFIHLQKGLCSLFLHVLACANKCNSSFNVTQPLHQWPQRAAYVSRSRKGTDAPHMYLSKESLFFLQSSMHLDYLIHLLFNLAIRIVYLLVRKGQVLHVFIHLEKGPCSLFLHLLACASKCDSSFNVTQPLHQWHIM